MKKSKSHIKHQLLALHNRMALSKDRTRQSRQLAIHKTDHKSKNVTTNHHMNFSMIENLTYPIFMSLVLSAIPLMTVKILEILFQPMFDEYINPPPCANPQVPTVLALEPAVSIGTPSSMTIDQDTPSTSTSQTTPETPSPVIPLGVEETDHDIEVAHMDNNPFVEFPIP
nr:hypothetical protein [Tanacetum cinerariifolium]